MSVMHFWPFEPQIGVSGVCGRVAVLPNTDWCQCAEVERLCTSFSVAVALDLLLYINNPNYFDFSLLCRILQEL